MFWILIAFSALLSCIATYFTLHYSKWLGLVHPPNNRSSHTSLIPHGGGVGIVLAFIVALSVLVAWGYITVSVWLILAIIGSLLALIGFWDDLYGVPARWRFVSQCVAIGLAVWLIGSLPPLTMPGFEVTLGWWGNVGLVIFLLWWVNLYNFMDGIDGIAGVEALSIGMGLLILLAHSTVAWSIYSQTSLIILLLLAVTLGFLVWNWAPARIFMGDIGSTFLGFSLGCLGLLCVVDSGLSPWSCLILTGVFTIDASVTLLRRVVRREPWYQAHRNHMYQQLSDRWMAKCQWQGGQARTVAHRRVCYVVVSINALWLLPWAWVAQSIPAWGIVVLVLAWGPLVVLAWYWGTSRQIDTTP